MIKYEYIVEYSYDQHGWKIYYKLPHSPNSRPSQKKCIYIKTDDDEHQEQEEPLLAHKKCYYNK